MDEEELWRRSDTCIVDAIAGPCLVQTKARVNHVILPHAASLGRRQELDRDGSRNCYLIALVVAAVVALVVAAVIALVVAAVVASSSRSSSLRTPLLRSGRVA